MATSFPTYPATTFEQAVELAIFSSNQLHNIINADPLSTVETEDGDIPSVRKALVDNFYFKTPAITWAQGTTATVFNQLYTFSNGTTGTALWYAPTATASNPVTMGSSPEEDSNWRLYGWDTYSKSELAGTSGATYIGTESGSNVQTELNSSDQYAGDYTSSALTITSTNKWITYNGERWYVKPGTTVPFTTTGTSYDSWQTDSSKFISYTTVENNGIVIPDTEAIFSVTLNYPSFRSRGFYSADDGGGAVWVATGNTVTASAGTHDISSAKVYNANGYEYELSLNFATEISPVCNGLKAILPADFIADTEDFTCVGQCINGIFSLVPDYSYASNGAFTIAIHQNIKIKFPTNLYRIGKETLKLISNTDIDFGKSSFSCFASPSNKYSVTGGKT